MDRGGREPLDRNGEGEGSAERQRKAGGQDAPTRPGYDGESFVDWNDLLAVLTEAAVDAGLSGDLDWFEENMTAAKKSSAKFPLSIARNRGAEQLAATPSVVAGTIHSVKGAEADVVYVFPDVSRAGIREWTGSPEQQASVYRLFYVAMTRARETLVVCAPSEEYAVNLGS